MKKIIVSIIISLLAFLCFTACESKATEATEATEIDSRAELSKYLDTLLKNAENVDYECYFGYSILYEIADCSFANEEQLLKVATYCASSNHPSNYKYSLVDKLAENPNTTLTVMYELVNSNSPYIVSIGRDWIEKRIEEIEDPLR